MRIIAIDPGNEKSAWVIMRNHKILSKSFETNKFLRNALLYMEADHLVIEMVQSMGMAVGKEVFETVYWIGRFVEAWGRGFSRIYRNEIKMHLCGSMRAKDKNIRQALIDKLGPQGTKKNPGPTYGISSHLWSALAVGITYLETKC